MIKILTIIFCFAIVESIGVTYLSGGLKEINAPSQITPSAIVQIIKKGATNGKLLFGVFLEAIFFGGLCYLLSQWDVSLIWPLTSLGFLITPLAARIFLHEQVSSWRWAGIILIATGAALISYGEKDKQAKTPPAPSATAPAANIP